MTIIDFASARRAGRNREMGFSPPLSALFPGEDEAPPAPSGADRPGAGALAVEQYDREKVRQALDHASSEFAQKLSTVWRGEEDRFHRILTYQHYLAHVAAAGAVGFSTAALGFSIGERLLSFDVLPATALVAVILLMSYLFWRVMFARDLDELDHELLHASDEHIEKRLCRQMSEHLAILPVGGDRPEDADAAVISLFSILKDWRELERIPWSVRFRWLTYRAEARKKRLWKFGLGYSAALSLFILLIGFGALRPMIGGELGGWLGAMSPVLDLGGLRFALFAPGFAAFAAIALHIAHTHWVADKVLAEIAASLRVGSSIGGGRRRPPRDWGERIGAFDPSPILVGNYRTILAALIKCASK